MPLEDLLEPLPSFRNCEGLQEVVADPLVGNSEHDVPFGNAGRDNHRQAFPALAAAELLQKAHAAPFGKEQVQHENIRSPLLQELLGVLWRTCFGGFNAELFGNLTPEPSEHQIVVHDEKPNGSLHGITGASAGLKGLAEHRRTD